MSVKRKELVGYLVKKIKKPEDNISREGIHSRTGVSPVY